MCAVVKDNGKEEKQRWGQKERQREREGEVLNLGKLVTP